MQPFEIIGAPFTIWLAPVGTAFPLVTAAPGAGWTKLGTSGDRNYSDEGVQVMHDQTISNVSVAGATGPVKAFRTAEQLMISATLLDMTLEQLANVLGTVTTTAAGAGTAGTKKVGLSRGTDVALFALLARGPSPYADGMTAQYEVPRCYQSGNPRPQFTKGNPAQLALEFTALEDPAAATPEERFGRLIAQHQVAI